MTFSNRSKNILASLVGFAVAITAFEIIGRLAPLKTGFQASMVYMRSHPELGFEIDPNIGSFRFEQTCLQIAQVTVDSEGHRISKPDNQNLAADRSLRIAVLGDSFMMGREVADRETTAAQLADVISNSAVINYGVPGYGTIQAYLSYLHKARDFKPDITVLGFLDVNDIAENSPYLSRDEALVNSRPFFADDGETILLPRDKLLFDAQHGPMPRKIHSWLKENSFSYYAAFTYGVKPLQQLSQRRFASMGTPELASTDDEKQSQHSNTAPSGPETQNYWWERKELFRYLAIYQRNPDDKFEAAWRTTEKTLILLRDAIGKDQGHFVLMLIPAENAGWMSTALKQYEKEFGESAPPDFDLSYPAERLIQFGRDNDIDVLDLGPNFSAYRDRYRLREPYFAFHCDGHWNPLGHYIAANTLTEHLADQGVIDSTQRAKTDFMDYSPEQLLGKHALGTVFGWAQVYRGDSDIGKN